MNSFMWAQQNSALRSWHIHIVPLTLPPLIGHADGSNYNKKTPDENLSADLNVSESLSFLNN